MAGKPAFRLVGFCSSCPWRSPAGMPGHDQPTWRERTAAVGPRAGRQHHSAIVASRSWRQHHRPRRKRRHTSPATDGCCPAPARATASRSAAVGGEPSRSSRSPMAWRMNAAHVDPACPTRNTWRPAPHRQATCRMTGRLRARWRRCPPQTGRPGAAAMRRRAMRSSGRRPSSSTPRRRLAPLACRRRSASCGSRSPTGLADRRTRTCVRRLRWAAWRWGYGQAERWATGSRGSAP